MLSELYSLSIKIPIFPEPTRLEYFRFYQLFSNSYKDLSLTTEFFLHRAAFDLNRAMQGELYILKC